MTPWLSPVRRDSRVIPHRTSAGDLPPGRSCGAAGFARSPEPRSGRAAASVAAATAQQDKKAPATPSAQTAKAAKAEYSQAGSTYVGAETCKTCHEDLYNGWEKSPHWKQTFKEGGIAKHGCEDCHGPGSAHVEGGGDTSKIFIFKDHSTKEINDRCLTCHAGSTEHMNASNSEHTRADVSCISCHSPHKGKESNYLLVKSQPELCYTCHLQQKAQFEMPFHHRVNEGLVQCSDCHNPHGTAGPKQVRANASQDQVCFKCHTDKQGPLCV